MSINLPRRSRTPLSLAAFLCVLAACGGGSSEPTADAGTEATDPAPTESAITDPPATDPPNTDPPTTDAPATDPPATDASPASSPADRPEGTWLTIRRHEIAEPKYDGFKQGHPFAREWELVPTCESGPCDVELRPGADGDYAPPGFPTDPEAEQSEPGMLELQEDGSYALDETETDTWCFDLDGMQVERAATFVRQIDLTFVPASGSEPALLQGTLADAQVLNDKGRERGCTEYADAYNLVGQPADAWNDADYSEFSFGSYTWGGTVIDGDERYLESTPKYSELVFDNPLELESRCPDAAACEIDFILGGTANTTTTLMPDGSTLGGATLLSFGDCVKNETDIVVAEDGYSSTETNELRPAVVVDGEVLAMIGTHEYEATPTEAAVAASEVDCYPEFSEFATVVVIDQPNFGL